MRQGMAAVHLPPGIASEACALRGMWRADGLALVRVAHVMGADHAHRSGLADESATMTAAASQAGNKVTATAAPAVWVWVNHHSDFGKAEFSDGAVLQRNGVNVCEIGDYYYTE